MVADARVRGMAGRAAVEEAKSKPAVGEIDELTLHRARKKDPAALRRLIEMYRRPAAALIYRMMVGRPEDVEDVLQETFLRVVKAIDRFDPKGPAKPSTWILTIATRTAIDRLRKERRFDDDADVVSIASAAPSPEARAAAKDMKARVELEMAALPPDARAALVLRAYHDLDYDEIARIQAVEVGTVKSRIARARAALRRAVEVRDDRA